MAASYLVAPLQQLTLDAYCRVFFNDHVTNDFTKMKKSFFLSILILLISCSVQAQSDLVFVIKSNKEPLPGATVNIVSLQRSLVADSTGQVLFKALPSGQYEVTVSHIGFQTKQLSITLPQNSSAPVHVLMEAAEEEEEEEVIVQATRISRSITNTPTRIEVISGEELTEKGNMKPGDIRMLLNESTGIQTQQTSATSYNSSIRIQGLDGRYTQILRDGFPLYAGFSGGLSIMQIAPLDLRQVEVIKGASSTLYGGGAIAGLVNLVSKVPGAEREISFMANGTSAGGLDLSGFYSQQFERIGLTVFGSRNSNRPFDPANIGLTAIPKFERYTINPRLFIQGDRTSANVGVSYITEDRVGGSLNYIKEGTAGYFEENKTDRFTTQLSVAHRLGEQSGIQFKNSYTRFNRDIAIPAYRFEGLQQSSFSELTYTRQGTTADWIVGANVLTDDFNESRQSSNQLRDYHYDTYGIFIQNQWTPGGILTLETGLRGDYVKAFGFELLPRASAMLRFSPRVTVRVGGGFGYKNPTVFNEESERIQFRNIQPITASMVKNERSVGGNADINYNTRLGEVGLTLNHLFFYTRLNAPLILTPGINRLAFENAEGYMDSKGMETNLRLSYSDFKLFVGYTYADVNTHYYDRKEWFPLTARHRLNNVLMYEKEEKLKIGLEAYYFSPQRLNDGSTGKSYWIMGLMGEKLWEHFSIFINFENFTNTRQSRFDTIFTGSINNPVFRDIYAPVEGFVVNGGFKFRL